MSPRLFFHKLFKKWARKCTPTTNSIHIDNISVLQRHSSAVIENSEIILNGHSELIIAEGVIIKGSSIILNNARVTLSSDSVIEGAFLKIEDSTLSILPKVTIKIFSLLESNSSYVEIGEQSILQRRNNALTPCWNIEGGTAKIGNHNVISCSAWVRFCGILEIGEYNCVNEGTEIRCDEKVQIGDYNMVSYNCNIWDTNTHCMYSPNIRRERTKKDFPYIGREVEKPKTKPVIIGSDCWIGKNAALLKGSIIHDGGVVGYGAIVSDQTIKVGERIVPYKAHELKL